MLHIQLEGEIYVPKTIPMAYYDVKNCLLMCVSTYIHVNICLCVCLYECK